MHLANVAGSFNRSMPEPCLSCGMYTRARLVVKPQRGRHAEQHVLLIRDLGAPGSQSMYGIFGDALNGRHLDPCTAAPLQQQAMASLSLHAFHTPRFRHASTAMRCTLFEKRRL